MTIAALILGLAATGQTVDKPTLQYYQQTFVIRQQDDVLRIPLVQPVLKIKLYVAFRKNDGFAVWDDRGLTVRRGPRAVSTRLPAIAVSPKVFSREEIRSTLRSIQAGERTKDAGGLSGAKRIGTDAYFLVRWEDQEKKPWAEALVKVDLSATKPEPELVGRFEGLSSASKPIDDELSVVGNKLAIVSHRDDTWGLATYDPESRTFDYTALGDSLVDYLPVSPTQGLFIERTSYKTSIVGRIDLSTKSRSVLYEGREKLRLIDSTNPPIVLASKPGTTKLINAETGVVRSLPYQLECRRAGADVICWTPAETPQAVWLISPASWEIRARWREAGQ